MSVCLNSRRLKLGYASNAALIISRKSWEALVDCKVECEPSRKLSELRGAKGGRKSLSRGAYQRWDLNLCLPAILAPGTPQTPEFKIKLRTSSGYKTGPRRPGDTRGTRRKTHPFLHRPRTASRTRLGIRQPIRKAAWSPPRSTLFLPLNSVRSCSHPWLRRMKMRRTGFWGKLQRLKI